MKTIRTLVAATALVLAGSAASVTLAQPMQGGGPGGWHQRFEQMDRKLDEAGRAHGPERRAHLREHMTMMHEHMQAMQGMMGPMGRGMMGGGMGQGGMGQGNMGQGGMGPGNKGPGNTERGEHGDTDRFRHMQDRLDLMQGMMEQMRKQHELMLRDDN